ncbi:translation elongation factor Ts [bacterium]|nr:translation elongation factor Ts [bacterium]
MTVTVEQIKQLRTSTGASMMACKKALEEADSDTDKAIDILRKNGEAKAAKRAERATGQGVISSYIHSNNKLGVLVHLGCETDFVAKNDDFQALAKDIAMHIAASAPLYLSPDEVSADLIEKEKEIWKEQLKNEGKPENIWDKIMEGKERKFREELALLTQPFVKNPDLTVEDLLKEAINKIGENIKLEKFVRYSI